MTPLPSWLRTLIAGYVGMRKGSDGPDRPLFITDKGRSCYRELVGATVARLCRTAGLLATTPSELRDDTCRELLKVEDRTTVASHMGFTRASHVGRLLPPALR